MKVRTLYVVYRLNSGAIETDTIKVIGKVNENVVAKIIRDKMSYYDREWPTIISWQDTEPFTGEESSEFWKNA